MFAQRLKELRKQQGLTQIEFAQRFHVSNGAVGMWETGKREPDFDTMTRLADFFNVSVDYLLGNVSEPFFYLDNERILREISSYGDEEEKVPTRTGAHQISDADIRAAFFGGADDLSEEEMDAMWDDAKDYVQYKLEQRRRKKNGGTD